VQVARNRLTTLRGLSSAAASLDALDCSGNPLPCLDSLPTHLPILSELCIRDCTHITTLTPLCSQRCPELLCLDAANTGVTEDAISCDSVGLAGLEMLLELDLRGCPSFQDLQSAATGAHHADLLPRILKTLPQLVRLNGRSSCTVQTPPQPRRHATSTSTEGSMLPDGNSVGSAVTAGGSSRAPGLEPLAVHIPAEVPPASEMGNAMADQMYQFMDSVGIPRSRLLLAQGKDAVSRTDSRHVAAPQAATCSSCKLTHEAMQSPAAGTVSQLRPGTRGANWPAQAYLGGPLTVSASQRSGKLCAHSRPAGQEEGRPWQRVGGGGDRLRTPVHGDKGLPTNTLETDCNTCANSYSV
jgi:hypothetical protein